MPDSTSFPSGHSASAFAFATAAVSYLPELGGPLRLLGGVVAYSRVHTGVHYPGDAVVGSVIGGTAGAIVAAVTQRWLRGRSTAPASQAGA
jgi:undecaprenyl-diphosphatase